MSEAEALCIMLLDNTVHVLYLQYLLATASGPIARPQMLPTQG